MSYLIAGKLVRNPKLIAITINKSIEIHQKEVQEECEEEENEYTTVDSDNEDD